MIVLRGAIFLALGALLDPCSKVGIGADKGTSAPAGSNEVSAAPLSPEQVSVDEAKKLCAAGDCLTAHDRIQLALPPSSPIRQTPEFKSLENRWAQSAISGAAADPDVATRRKVLEEVIASNVIDAPYKTQATDALAKLPAPSADAPDASTDAAAPAADSAASKSKDRGGHRSHSKKGEK